MKGIKQYINKQEKVSGRIVEDASENLGLVIVIPAYKEEDIAKTLSSLFACDVPDCDVEVIVFVNGKATDNQGVRKQNEDCVESIRNFISQHLDHRISLFYFADLSLEKKQSGVGRARKILMDEALFRLNQVNKDGIIVNLDADCTVQNNYLTEIEKYFSLNRKSKACSIYYEHPLTGKPIVDYEIHLRYFIGMQRHIGLPFAFQTVGSAMACRAETYAAVGGMNKKQAGEDFYFMHKFISIGVCGELNETTVFPSGRTSDRVPFGTGRAVGEIESGNDQKTYNPRSFEIIRPLVDELKVIYSGQYDYEDAHLAEYLESIGFGTKVQEIRNNTGDFIAFQKRFYQFFDAFKLMKCLHFLRDSGYKDVSLDEALSSYFTKLGKEGEGDRIAALLKMRKWDKERLC